MKNGINCVHVVGYWTIMIALLSDSIVHLKVQPCCWHTDRDFCSDVVQDNSSYKERTNIMDTVLRCT